MMRVLAMAASFRNHSLNRKLIEVAAEMARRKRDVAVDFVSFRDFYMPVYDGDLEAGSGLPYGAEKLSRRIEMADAVLLASPEYNHSVPGALKNAIDWSSRRKSNPWQRKPVLLLSASPSRLGGARGLKHLRTCLNACGAEVYPETYSLSEADKTIDLQSGNMVLGNTEKERLNQLLSVFIERNRRLRRKPDAVRKPEAPAPAA